MTPYQQTWRSLMRQWALDWRSSKVIETRPVPKKLWRHSHWYDEVRRVIAASSSLSGKISHPAIEAAIRCRERAKVREIDNKT